MGMVHWMVTVTFDLRIAYLIGGVLMLLVYLGAAWAVGTKTSPLQYAVIVALWPWWALMFAISIIMNWRRQRWLSTARRNPTPSPKELLH